MREKRVINSTLEIPIQPSDINTDKHFMGSFDHMETETSARWIVRLCQTLGGWEPFTMAQLLELYAQKFPGESFLFNRLIHPGTTFSIISGPYQAGGGWVVQGEDGKYRVTDDFVLRCYHSAPAARLKEGEKL
jgi:hypothetical protein